MMNDEVGQQRLHAAQRVSPVRDQQSVTTRVEAAQEGPDEAMNQALASSSARNVKPRVEVSREASTGVGSRVEDVLPSRRRGSEETTADELMGISEMTVIFMSLGVAPANFKVAELFCRDRFGEAAVSVGFERALVVDNATD